MKEITIKVAGIMCEGCENRIKNSIKNIEKVDSVEASHKDGIVKITAQEGVDEKAIR